MLVMNSTGIEGLVTFISIRRIVLMVLMIVW